MQVQSRPSARQRLIMIGVAALVGCGGPAAVPQRPTPTPSPPTRPEPILAAEPAPAGLDTVRAGRYDNGKMWTFEYPPLDYFRQTYGFAPDSAWFVRARLSALRVNRCSASFVSPNGLVLTNHHCARESISQVSRSGEKLLDEGFYARSLDEERPVAGFHADQLIAIVDVTDEVSEALEGIEDAAERADARERSIEEITDRVTNEYGGADADIIVETIALWNGARYSAYVFQRYQDLRLVMAPHGQVAFFGGDPDNFTYPRYDLDLALFRAYDQEGNPLQTDHYFPWNRRGVEQGDAVFVIGNPGSTSRLQTVSQLEFRRDVLEPAIVTLYRTRVDALREHAGQRPEDAEALDLQNTIFELSNSHKAYRGMWKGLRDPVIMAKRRDTERRFRQALAADSALSRRYGELHNKMAEVQEQKAALAAELTAFLALDDPRHAAAVLGRALWTYPYLVQRERGVPEEALSQLKEQMLSVASQPGELQSRLLAARLSDFRRYLGDDSQIVQQILKGRTPAAAAQAIVAASALADSAEAAEALAAGSLTLADPALEMVGAFFQRFVAFFFAMQEITEAEGEVAIALGRARLAIHGTTIPPDATFSLRIADGVVTGYEYNGTYAPPYTTFYGMYDRYYSFGAGSEWDLPEAWVRPPASFELTTPLNFVFTADATGGNSGSPVVDQDLELVGVMFDGNIESLPGDYIYDPVSNRSVAVDVRGMLEALDEIYDADRLVLELTTGRLMPTEEAADAVLVGQ